MDNVIERFITKWRNGELAKLNGRRPFWKLMFVHAAWEHKNIKVMSYMTRLIIYVEPKIYSFLKKTLDT